MVPQYPRHNIPRTYFLSFQPHNLQAKGNIFKNCVWYWYTFFNSFNCFLVNHLFLHKFIYFVCQFTHNWIKFSCFLFNFPPTLIILLVIRTTITLLIKKINALILLTALNYIDLLLLNWEILIHLIIWANFIIIFLK